MGATGESVKRLTDVGFNPSWSPDQKEIVFSTESVVNPEGRGLVGRLWAVNVSTGAKRQLTEWDAVQPQWSPHGYRIAYWAVPEGGSQRDIWTMPASGGKPVAVTHDLYVDWNPVWSPGGNYLYFSSDRAGSLNLWRVRIDENSGKTLAAPEPVTTPSPYVADLSFSRDGSRLAYADVRVLQNIYGVEFDPLKETVKGQPVALTQGTRRLGGTNPSPDGQWLVFRSIGAQEDIFISKRDGTGMRQLTDDIYSGCSPLIS